MAFNVTAEDYGRFMGRYSERLAVDFADLSQVDAGQRALDVGCGPGALTAELVERLGPGAVAAVDPSPSFVEAVRARLPVVDARAGVAEQLPFGDAAFDVALAQLVVHFMTDPVAGLREMARVTCPGGLVAACVWDHAGGRGPLGVFWRAAHDVDPGVRDESALAGAREGHLQELFEAAGLGPAEQTVLTVRATFATAEDWWQPFTLGVGPAGDYVKRLDGETRDALRARCAELLAAEPIEVAASAWAVRARVA